MHNPNAIHQTVGIGGNVGTLMPLKRPSTLEMRP